MPGEPVVNQAGQPGGLEQAVHGELPVPPLVGEGEVVVHLVEVAAGAGVLHEGAQRRGLDAAERESKHDALRTVAILPAIMFLVYLGLILWFRSRGGYKPVVLDLKH